MCGANLGSPTSSQNSCNFMVLLPYNKAGKDPTSHGTNEIYNVIYTHAVRRAIKLLLFHKLPNIFSWSVRTAISRLSSADVVFSSQMGSSAKLEAPILCPINLVAEAHSIKLVRYRSESRSSASFCFTTSARSPCNWSLAPD